MMTWAGVLPGPSLAPALNGRLADPSERAHSPDKDGELPRFALSMFKRVPGVGRRRTHGLP
jgi:hypothetical protein